MQGFTDLGDYEEDQRIEIIGKTVMEAQKPSSCEKPFMMAFIVENDEKADRYIEKIKKKFPKIRIIDRLSGPVPNTIAVRIAAPLV